MKQTNILLILDCYKSMIFVIFPSYLTNLIFDTVLLVKFICQCLRPYGKTQPIDQFVTQPSEKIATPLIIRIASVSLGSSANPSKNLLFITPEPSILSPNLQPLTRFKTQKAVLLTCRRSHPCSIHRKKCGRMDREMMIPSMHSVSN